MVGATGAGVVVGTGVCAAVGTGVDAGVGGLTEVDEVMDSGGEVVGVEEGDGRTEGDELDGGDEAFPGSASSLVAFTLIPHESPLAVTSSSYVEFQYTKKSSSTARILALSIGPPASDGLADGVRVLV